MPIKRILVVDDEESIQTVVRFGIQMVVDWEVLVASSGMQCIKIAGDEKPDAILLDVMMPDMDGLSTFKALQADPQTAQIPVIFLTAKVQTSERRQFNDLLVSGVIMKPFNSLDLPDLITQILDW
ncbi:MULTISPECIES: response regulator [Pseudanabaena]|uniref:Response regulator receiver protein n=2 Tax=Pseudanabaena TaxID=1152 RepID=L8N373_9CYAN|nr:MULTISPECIES: response regulator [Pseudanabaena]ELS32698.1 response regulator receiver protein [Pseudanabaena biceps PCC 7429]MDG3495087.1 response regulator [Pseudanabaena catenata USMAC16]